MPDEANDVYEDHSSLLTASKMNHITPNTMIMMDSTTMPITQPQTLNVQPLNISHPLWITNVCHSPLDVAHHSILTDLHIPGDRFVLNCVADFDEGHHNTIPVIVDAEPCIMNSYSRGITH